LIYGDLDNFKAYNDKYGFEQGDRILLLTAKIIQFCSKKYGLQDDFVGHIGGDDFVIISHPDCAERISTRIIKIFDRVVPGHYNSADRKQGVIRGKDKENVEKQFPFMGISLAVIEVNSNGDNDRRVTSLREIVGATAGLKKYAKSIPGSVYIKDRRSF
jgi:GGDEF domain-containing protein